MPEESTQLSTVATPIRWWKLNLELGCLNGSMCKMEFWIAHSENKLKELVVVKRKGNTL